MIQSYAIKFVDTKIEILWFSALFILIPSNIILSLTASAYLVQITEQNYWLTNLYFLFPIVIISLVVGTFFIYPFEYFTVKNRAITSLNWATIRVLYIMGVGTIIAFVTFCMLRGFAEDYVPIIPRIRQVFYVAALVQGFMVGVVTTFFERVFNEIVQREANLSRQIMELKVEIDRVSHQNDVQQIVESDAFLDLQARAKELRERKTE